MCHCEEAAGRRGNLAGSGWITGQLRRIRKLVREIATGAKRPRNDNSEVHTILTMACTNRQCSAGPGCPLPYNGVYNRREYPEICSCHRRSVSAATDAIGWCVFIGTLYELKVPSRDCHVASLLAMTSLGALHIRRKYLQICSCQRRSLSAATDAIGAYRFHGGRYESAALRREGHAPPLQLTVGGPAKNSTLRVSRFLPQIFPFLCITSCIGGKTCCGEGQHAWNRSCAVCPTGPTRAR